MEYRKLVEAEFKEFTREVLEKTWEWLNDPEIRELTATPVFDRESQEKWFEGLKTRKDYFIRSCWHNDKVIGVVGLKNLTDKHGEIFGYLGEKEYWGKTIGVQGMEYIIDYARSINLECIYSVVRRTNISSYKLDLRLGFVRDKDIDENTIQMRLDL